MSYQIVVTYDTGDTFHQEHDVEGTIERTWQNGKKSRGFMEWEDLDKAKKALKDIEEHYHCYMIYIRSGMQVRMIRLLPRRRQRGHLGFLFLKKIQSFTLIIGR